MTKYAFFGGEFVPIEKAKVSIMTHALHYGTGCFEGIRAYWNEEEEQLFIFRMREHYERFQRSHRILMISLPYSVDDLCQMTVELLRREKFTRDAYIRPLAYKATEAIGVRLHDLEDAFALFAVPFGKYIGEEGCKACVSSWRRMDDSIAPPRGKITGVYINSALAKTEAVLDGYDEAIMLNQDGHVSEGSGENICIVRDGRIITPPVTDNILEGITLATLMQLARDELGIEAVERPIDHSELYIAEEAFYTGTAAEITPIVEIDHRLVGDGKIGPIVSKLRALFFDVVRGKVEKYRSWCTPVY